MSLILTNTVVFLAQRYPKFLKECLHLNHSLRAEKEGGLGRRRFRPALVFFTATPSHLMVPAPIPAVFSLFGQLVNHLRGGVKSFEGAGPIDVLHLHSGRVSKFSRVMVPREVEADSLASSGWLFQVPNGSLLGKARLSMELSLRPPVLSGNSDRRHPQACWWGRV